MIYSFGFIASALLYALSLIFIEYFWWFQFLVWPLFFAEVLHKRVSAGQSFLWGCIVFGTYALPIYAAGLLVTSAAAIIAALIFLVSYLAVTPVLWFWVTGMLTAQVNRTLRLIIWSMSLTLFFFWMTHCSFFIFGDLEGFACFSPLAVCMNSLCMRLLLFIFGEQALTFVLCLCSAFIGSTVCARAKDPGQLTCSLRDYGAVMVFFLGAWAAVRLSALTFAPARPVWLDQVVKSSVPFDPEYNQLMWDAAHQVRRKIKKAAKRGGRMLLFPESTFPFCLQSHAEVCDYWRDAAGDHLSIILGSHRREGDQLFNSCYFLRQNALDCYDKRHRLFMAERLPSWCTLAKDLFLKDAVPFTQSSKNSCSFEFEHQKLVPLICSELFFNLWPDTLDADACVVVIVNDAWYGGTFFSKLLFLTAQLKATQNHQRMLYVSQSMAAYLDNFGSPHDLPIV